MLIPNRLKMMVMALMFQMLFMPQAWADDSPAFAEQSDNRSSFQMPRKGQSQAEIISVFGPPQRTTRLDGKAHIRTWHYEYFSVFFREQQVIHSVRRHRNLYQIAAD
jgi:hypothetical protein